MNPYGQSEMGIVTVGPRADRLGSVLPGCTVKVLKNYFYFFLRESRQVLER